MIKKERKIPLTIRKRTALLRRLPPSHPKRPQIEKQLAKYNAGYRGERSIEYYLSFLPEKQYHIFHDLRLTSGDHFFQLDTLLVSPSFILILEVKNISGTLHFDNTFHQLIRTIEDRKEGFNDPLLQVEHQKTQLANWLSQHKFPP
ncbi:MAG TPA: nuclease-related domain-containing protein, partial [Bacillales bacterium]|nr:nuclease-related domain-containing protein [Bacillales bacterium]